MKTAQEIETDLDRWFWLFKHLSEADQMPRFMNRRVFKRIFQIAELANLSEDELMAYNASIQAEWDWQNAVELAEERAAEKAAARADENARKEERAKAEAEKRELLIQSARAFKKSGVPNAVIAESLGLPLEVVEKL